ncbi:hypothetical protein LMH87_011042 [Akanthomyces muscarius]|uniref:Uncharacterized protein n=1 Tax=Akanthomyces muscarius TaxID=2231603 RepID=A0A9W8QAQ9_AKAMU|nr:hypothetical protein LMH87_011042 [Akanthomyces muscarius]KAJ4150285.1 hypothetical protein LMH87_011042 [Akanthomyces muscarius]
MGLASAVALGRRLATAVALWCRRGGQPRHAEGCLRLLSKSVFAALFHVLLERELKVKKVVRLKLAPHCANGDEMKRMLDGRASCTVDCWLAR